MLFDPRHASALKIQDMDPRDNIKWTITIDNDWTNVLMSIDNNCTNMLCCIQPVIHNKDDCILTGFRNYADSKKRWLTVTATSGFVYCAWQIWLQLPISAIKNDLRRALVVLSSLIIATTTPLLANEEFKVRRLTSESEVRYFWALDSRWDADTPFCKKKNLELYFSATGRGDQNRLQVTLPGRWSPALPKSQICMPQGEPKLVCGLKQRHGLNLIYPEPTSSVPS